MTPTVISPSFGRAAPGFEARAGPGVTFPPAIVTGMVTSWPGRRSTVGPRACARAAPHGTARAKATDARAAPKRKGLRMPNLVMQRPLDPMAPATTMLPITQLGHGIPFLRAVRPPPRSVAGIIADVLRVEPARQLAVGRDRQFEPLELHRILHARLELGRMERDHAALARPAARGELIERAIGEHVGEAAVRPELELRAHLHHTAEPVVASERGVGRRTTGGAGAGHGNRGQREGGGENGGFA